MVIQFGKTKSIITLNVNGLYVLIKRQRVTKCIKNQDPSICFWQRVTSDLKTHRDGKWRDGKGYSMQMEVGDGGSQVNNTYTRQNSRTVSKDKEKHYIMIKRLTLHGDATILNMYAPNSLVLKCMRQNLKGLQREIH